MFRRLHVFVQDTDTVRRAQRAGDLGGDVRGGVSRGTSLEPTASGPPHWGEIAALGVLDLEEVRGLVELPVEDLGDVFALAEVLLEQPEEHDFSLQSPHALRLEAELEGTLGLRLLVTGAPDLAEAAFAETLFENPVRSVRYREAARRAPAQRLRFTRGNRAPRGFRVVWRSQKRQPLDSNLEDLDGRVAPLEEIGAMGQPVHRRPVGGRGLLLPPGVEGDLGDQDVTGLGQTQHARTDLHRSAFEAPGIGALRRDLSTCTAMPTDRGHPISPRRGRAGSRERSAGLRKAERSWRRSRRLPCSSSRPR